MKTPRTILRVLTLLSSQGITVVGLAFLLALTIWGTIFQVKNGLYQAQHQFYQSWFFVSDSWLPFPGAKLVMTVLFVNLVAAGLRFSLLGYFRAGLALTHGGLLIMLGAGAVIFYFAEESHLVLLEGEATNVTESRRAWELALWPAGENDRRHIRAVDLDALRSGKQLPFPGSSATLLVEKNFTHAEPLPNRDATVDRLNGSGISDVKQLRANKEPGDDRPALLFTLREAGSEQARVLLWGGDTAPTKLTINGADYFAELRRRRTLVPATIELVDFRKEMHPGVDMARSFQSLVRVKPEQGAERKVTISMNKPLRFAGFTFYQSSFHVLPDGREASEFSVVKNYGRAMPYIATGVTVLGLVLHFAGLLLVRMRHSHRSAETTT